MCLALTKYAMRDVSEAITLAADTKAIRASALGIQPGLARRERAFNTVPRYDDDRKRAPAMHALKVSLILGPSRSGKTSVELHWSKSARCYAGGEAQDIYVAATRLIGETGYPDGDTLGLVGMGEQPRFEKYMSEICQRRFGDLAKPVTYTLPGLVFDLPDIQRLLPGTRVISVERAPEDLRVAILLKAFKKGNLFSYFLPDIDWYIERYNHHLEAFAKAFPDRFTTVGLEEMVRNA